MGGQYAVEMQMQRPSSPCTDITPNTPENMKDYEQSKTDPICCLTHHCLILSILYSKSMNHLYPENNINESKSVENQNPKRNSVFNGEEIEAEDEENIICGDSVTVIPLSIGVNSNPHKRTLSTILSPEENKPSISPLTSFTGSITVQSGFTLTALKDCDTAPEITAYKILPNPSSYDQMSRDTEEEDGEIPDLPPMPKIRRRNTPWPSIQNKYIANEARSGSLNRSAAIEVEPWEENSDTLSLDDDHEQDGMITNSTSKFEKIESEHRGTTIISTYDVYVD